MGSGLHLAQKMNFTRAISGIPRDEYVNGAPIAPWRSVFFVLY
jgi:hypothetical protein